MKRKKSNLKGSFKEPMIKLVKFCKSQWIWLGISIILGAIAVVFQIIGPNKIKDLTTIIIEGLQTGGIDLEAFTSIALFLLIIYFFMITSSAS